MTDRNHPPHVSVARHSRRLGQLGSHLGGERASRHVAPAEAPDPVAARLEEGIAINVPRPAMRVVAPAIELDDEPLASPEQVDLDAESHQPHVDPRPRQTGVVEALERNRLQLRARAVSIRVAPLEHASQHCSPTEPTPSPQHLVYGVLVVEPFHEGGVDGPGDEPPRPRPGQVDERPRDRGDRNAVALGAVAAGQLGPVDDQPGKGAAARLLRRDGDIVAVPRVAEQAPRGRRAAVGEHGAVAAGQDGGQPVALRPQLAVPHGVDRSVKGD